MTVAEVWWLSPVSSAAHQTGGMSVGCEAILGSVAASHPSRMRGNKRAGDVALKRSSCLAYMRYCSVPSTADQETDRYIGRVDRGEIHGSSPRMSLTSWEHSAMTPFPGEHWRSHLDFYFLNAVCCLNTDL